MATEQILARDARLAHSIAEAVRLTGLSRTYLYAALRTGALKARKVGRRTLILDDDLRVWITSFPAVREAA